MADLPTPDRAMADNTSKPNSSEATPPKREPPLHEKYAQPAPIKTFPLPSFYPSNPLSIIYLAYAWIKQYAKPPPKEPLVIHKATWSVVTTSVHVTDEASMSALWEQGFYGKGSLSRSEPNWLNRELVRKGLKEGYVSELATAQRREERIQAKWERARLEQEAIRQMRLEEARRAEQRHLTQQAAQIPHNVAKAIQKGAPTFLAAPVGPLELLALPNSAPEPHQPSTVPGALAHGVLPNGNSAELHIKDETLAISDSNGLFSSLNLNGHATPPSSVPPVTGRPNGNPANGVPVHAEEPPPYTPSPRPGLSTIKNQKSVRFSAKVDSTTFGVSDPPSPGAGQKPAVTKPGGTQSANGSASANQEQGIGAAEITNKEHLQLMPEEALWLSFALGTLVVSDAASGEQLSTEALLTLFRQYSHIPPRVGDGAPALQPDDDFLVHYAVYHHFRSQGWVPRAGIKFGVDWLLYARGPVFDHAEFGLVVIPAYSDPWWKNVGKRSQQLSWYKLHNLVRVLSHVIKSLVIIYVEVPPPHVFDESLESGFGEALKKYRVREVMVKRWAVNRNR